MMPPRDMAFRDIKEWNVYFSDDLDQTWTRIPHSLCKYDWNVLANVSTTHMGIVSGIWHVAWLKYDMRENQEPRQSVESQRS